MEDKELNSIDLLAHKKIADLRDEINELKKIINEQNKKIIELENKEESNQ